MGLFDGAFGNKKEEDFSPVRAVQPVKGQVLITFLPSGAQVNAKPGATNNPQIPFSRMILMQVKPQVSALAMQHGERGSMYHMAARRASAGHASRS